MKREPATVSTIALLPLFSLFLLAVLIPGLCYNGPGENLHMLSVSAFALFLWLSLAIGRQDLSRFKVTGGWLPALGITYFAWLAAAPLLSPYPYISSVRAAELAALPLALLAWLAEPQEKTREFRAFIAQLMLVVALCLAGWGIVDFLVFQERGHGPFIDPNAYGALINLFLVPAVAVYLGVGESSVATKNRALLLAAITVLALALFMSLSRGALLAFGAVSPPLLWLAHTSRTLRTRLPSLLLALTGAYLFVKFGPVDPQGLKAGIEGLLMSPDRYLQQDSAVQARFLLWTATWRMILDSNILTGMGLGTFKTFYPPYRMEGDHSAGNFAHNDYLQALQEGGLVQLFFLIAFTIAAPLWLLYKNRLSRTSADSRSALIPGLLLGILCVSLQAIVNFIHLLVPIAFLTGLYLAIGWETTTQRSNLQSLEWVSSSIRPWILKGSAIALLAVHTSVILADGIIYKAIGSTAPLLAYFSPDDRFAVLNGALSLRPKNPTPRVLLIRHLIDRAEQEGSAETRRALLEQAEKETRALSQVAPGYPLVSLLFGSIWAARGTPADLMIARDYMEAAVRSTPHSTGMRTELIKVYRQLGQDEQAYRVVIESVPWLPNEASASALGRFAAEAESLALLFNDPKQASYWSWIRSQVSELQQIRG